MTNENFEKLLNEIKNSEFTKEEIDTMRSAVVGSAESMTKDQYDTILLAIEKAQDSTRPFVIATDELTVAGDANETQINPFDYEITFHTPVYENGNIVKIAEEVKTYKNVFVTPRKQTKVEKLLVMIMPYFKKEDGGNYTTMEMLEIFSSLDETLYDYMYDLVSYILDIPDSEKEYMTVASVVAAAIRFMFNTPEAVNEANAFFGSSPGTEAGTGNAQNLSSLI